MVTYWCWWNLRPIGWSDWENLYSHIGTQHMSITCRTQIWNLTIRFEECNESFILVNYGHNETIGFRERRGQNLVKAGQTRSNLINGLDTTRLGKIHIQILIIRIEEYDNILMLVKFENNWMVRLREYIWPYRYTTHVHHVPLLDLKSNCSIWRV